MPSLLCRATLPPTHPTLHTWCHGHNWWRIVWLLEPQWALLVFSKTCSDWFLIPVQNVCYSGISRYFKHSDKPRTNNFLSGSDSIIKIWLRGPPHEKQPNFDILKLLCKTISAVSDTPTPSTTFSNNGSHQADCSEVYRWKGSQVKLLRSY